MNDFENVFIGKTRAAYAAFLSISIDICIHLVLRFIDLFR
jgi:hypothetical protein